MSSFGNGDAYLSHFSPFLDYVTLNLDKQTSLANLTRVSSALHFLKIIVSEMYTQIGVSLRTASHSEDIS